MAPSPAPSACVLCRLTHTALQPYLVSCGPTLGRAPNLAGAGPQSDFSLESLGPEGGPKWLEAVLEVTQSRQTHQTKLGQVAAIRPSLELVLHEHRHTLHGTT